MKTTTHTLSNGLQLLLEEEHSAPVISINILIKVGSAMETDAEAGISHFIEHMLFKGTPNRAVGRIARDVEAAGGDINAYTSFDQTVYYINMASRFADDGLAILADAVQHPLFDAEEVKRESEVICEEIRRGEDNPSHQLSEFIFEHTYGTHPYGRPIIGFAKTVQGFTRDDLLSYWQRWYTPSNMVVILVGDFDTADMIQKCETAFGAMPGRAAPTPLYINQTIAATEPRCFQHRANIESSYFGISCPIASILHQDVPALDVLSHILGGGESSRLELQVKEHKRLVQNIYSYAYTPRSAGIFLIGGTATTNKMEKTIAAIRDEVHRLREEPANAAELAYAKLNIISNALYERETVGGQGGKHAYLLATAGDHTFEDRYFEAVQRTTPEDVHGVARRYLPAAHWTMTWLAPDGEKLPAPRKIIQLMTSGEKRKVTAIPGPRASLSPAVFRLANGLRVLVRPQHRLPLLACRMFSLGGMRHETPPLNGINALLSNTLTKSTTHRDVAAVAQSIDAIAGDFGAASGFNTFGVRAEFLSEKLREGFELLSEIMTYPAFDVAEVTKEKSLLLEAIKNQKDHLPALAMNQFTAALYGKHPYALPRLGQADTVRKITPAILERFYRRLLNPKNMVLSLAGDIDVETARELATKHFSWLSPRGTAEPRPYRLAPVKAVTLVAHRQDRKQAHIIYGMRALTVGSDDRYAFSVLNQILAGQGGRLFLRLRDEMSLAYAVSASHQLGLDPGYFTVYIGTEPTKIDTAIAGIKRELRLLIEQPVSDEELTRAHQYLVGTYELDLQRNSAVASLHALNLLFGLGLEEAERYPKEILKVTKADLLRVARRYLREDHAVCSIVQPS